jgi:hypothetical protein
LDPGLCPRFESMDSPRAPVLPVTSRRFGCRNDRLHVIADYGI